MYLHGPTAEFNRLFSLMLTPLFADTPHMPASDMLSTEETDSAVVLRAVLPGVAPEDIAVSAHSDRITITAKVACSWACASGSSESKRTLERTVRFRSPIDPEKVTATYKHGILTVQVPKPAQPEGRQIPLSVEGA